MSHPTRYATQEVCDFFGVSKATLFRWEHDERLPAQERRGIQRLYSGSQVCEAVEREQIAPQYRRAIRDSRWRSRIMERSARLSLAGGNVCGLRELAAMDHVSPETVKFLIRFADRKCQPGERLLAEILAVLAKSNRRLVAAGKLP